MFRGEAGEVVGEEVQADSAECTAQPHDPEIKA